MKNGVFLFICGLILCSCAENTVMEQKEVKPVDQVYPLLDAANSRWFFFASASRPFGMVTLNPDTQIGGAWGSGYKYDTDTIKGFSHIHGWQMAGVSVMPVVISNTAKELLTDNFSSFSHDKEVVEVGYQKVELDRYDITSELTSTPRVGFHRYTFPGEEQGGVVFKFEGLLGPSEIKDGLLNQVSPRSISGQMTNAPTVRRPKDFIVYFHVEFDKEITDILKSESSANQMITFAEPDQVLMKVGISYTSVENARVNLEAELPGWNFDTVVKDSKDEWNDLLSRIEVTGNDRMAERRFYTDLWHSLQGRRMISDANGAYPDNTGESFRIGQLPVDESGKPIHNHYNSDSFWGAQWTLNTLWGLVYPEIYSEFIRSLMVYYRDGGLVPRGPSGGNYTYVMTGASSTPFVVSAFQKGIEIGDSGEVYEALKKNHMPKGIMAKVGYEHETFLGGGLEHYLEKGFVPYPIPEGDFGYHQDGASLTLEYAYQDWTLSQMAKELGKIEDYSYFLKRSENYKNQFDKASGWMRPKDAKGAWREPFDPYEYEHGFIESNGAQATWFVGHDIPGLANLMGGKEKAVEKLNTQFEEAAKRGFTAGTSHERGEDPGRARIPINYGNQPSIQTAFIFNQLGRPDLTQKWNNEVLDSAFSRLSPHTGYNGDEDQGLMGSLAVLMKLGFFQLNGGTEADPVYELTTPRFETVRITLPNGKELTIRKDVTGTTVDEILFNTEVINGFSIRHSQLMEGGELVYSLK